MNAISYNDYEGEGEGDFSGQLMILAFVFGVVLAAVLMNLKFRRDSNAKIGEARYEYEGVNLIRIN